VLLNAVGIESLPTIAEDLGILVNPHLATTILRRRFEYTHDQRLAKYRVGWLSMGTGEVRAIWQVWLRTGAKAVLMAPPSLLLKTTNPEGVDQSVFDGIMKAIVEDRPAYFSEFFKAFFNVDVFARRISNDAIQASWNVAVVLLQRERWIVYLPG